jgi:hypothetical protein
MGVIEPKCLPQVCQFFDEEVKAPEQRIIWPIRMTTVKLVVQHDWATQLREPLQRLKV